MTATLPTACLPTERQALKRIAIEGVEYACPFWNSVRPHTSVELATLEADILRVGYISMPVLVYYSWKYGWSIIDGMTRATLAIKHNLYVGTYLEKNRDGKALTDAEAEDRAKALNYARRHLSPEELAAAQQKEKQERIERVKAAIAQNPDVSLRELAAQEEVSHVTIKRDLDSIEPAASPPLRRKRLAIPQAQSAAKLLVNRVTPILGSAEKRMRLRLIAEGYGVPLSENGKRWPALEAILASLRDLG